MLSTYTTLRPPEISGKNQMQGVRATTFLRRVISAGHTVESLRAIRFELIF